KGEVSEIGIATVLAWTAAGGEIVTTETSLMKGAVTLPLTATLGDVIQDPARASVSYMRTRAEMYAPDPNFAEKSDILIHQTKGVPPTAATLEDEARPAEGRALAH